MSQESEAPDWSLLPHSPQAFFGVEAAGDRKDLKRAYNRLLRQFKPEKFPAEFQRIREAYELLDNQLRYGAALNTAAPLFQQYQWQTDDGPSKNGKPDASPTPPTESPDKSASVERAAAPTPLHVRINEEPLPELYRELADKPHKLPYDYFALAVLSDALHRQSEQQFVSWILKGLAEHPRDPALRSLLYEYLRGPMPIDVAARLLMAVSKVIRTDEFFPLTEHLWRRLLRERPFSEFAATLHACQSNLRTIDIDGRLVFTIEILKSAIWLADRDWIEQAFTLIEENFQRIPPQLAFDLDLLDLLKRYIAGRPPAARLSPLRQKIDSALRAYFAGDEQEARDREILECQVLMAQAPQAVLDSFPFESSEDHSHFYILWHFVTTDVAERHLADTKPVNVDAWRPRGRALYETIERRIKVSGRFTRWQLTGFMYNVGVAALYVILPVAMCLLSVVLFFSSTGNSFPRDVLAPTAASTVGLVMALQLHRREIRPRWLNYAGRQFTKIYVEISRSELAAFLQRSHFTHPELKELLFSADISKLSTAQSTADHFRMDYALAIYAMALRFQL
jgi:hypothetical protein